MQRAQCPHCAKTLRYRDTQAGTTVRCPACSQAVQLPQVNGSLPQPSTEGPSPWDLEATTPGATLGPEPWYYGFLTGYAKVVMGLSIAVMLLGSVWIVFSVTAIWGMLGRERFTMGQMVSLGFGGIVGLLALVLVLLGILFNVALILLFVDIGRNLRKIRQNTQH
jgi:hypothetical protein